MAAIPLTILALAAGVSLLIKVKKEGMGGLYSLLSWIVILLSILFIVGLGVRGWRHHRMGQPMMGGYGMEHRMWGHGHCGQMQGDGDCCGMHGGMMGRGNGMSCPEGGRSCCIDNGAAMHNGCCMGDSMSKSAACKMGADSAKSCCKK
jgi:hypothetical protein